MQPAARPDPVRVSAWSTTLALHLVGAVGLLATLAAPTLVHPVRAPSTLQVRWESPPPVAVPPPALPPPIAVHRVSPSHAPVISPSAVSEPSTQAVPTPSGPPVQVAVASEPPAQPASPVTLPEVGAMAYRSAPPPVYPTLARQHHWEGAVVLHVQVGPAGRPQAVEVSTSSGHAELDRAAREPVV